MQQFAIIFPIEMDRNWGRSPHFQRDLNIPDVITIHQLHPYFGYPILLHCVLLYQIPQHITIFHHISWLYSPCLIGKIPMCHNFRWSNLLCLQFVHSKIPMCSINFRLKKKLCFHWAWRSHLAAKRQIPPLKSVVRDSRGM